VHPFAIKNGDPLFDIFTATSARKCNPVNLSEFSSTITVIMNDRAAQSVDRYSARIAQRLYRWHREQMCWYTVGCVAAKAQAKASLANWLAANKVSEDDYSLDAAIKTWQRFGWDFDKKNAEKFGHLRRMSAPKVSKKTGRRAKSISPPQALAWKRSEVDAELVIGRFLAYYSETFRRVPRSLAQQAKCYTYIVYKQLSVRQAAARLGLKRSSTGYALKAMRTRMAKNPTVSRLMEQALDLPTPA
jgi:hypothetical protein